ncbi:Bug family tripartite tricarboxylate transporter substrate binding protein [Paracidovorax cattleyae]|uniref:Tripartite-type tricarboxylate transporter, receptor component TctC n=1 Tax=Paracidovorax cattleyae TaxID=80868 RepID=A0A1H0QPH2_9BURK|nr:tripartite tricarboxylate transporter substrate binding protein [Paracidovorax cattleyae]MBF9266779.1 tripartite tricarboxylate transporter substrate binding protein [Paracidovorax cattleyae]SDP18568.1 Tripartite-type tricarboxylate transporter, receptor component TctC [Paracidovorax cattleyae]
MHPYPDRRQVLASACALAFGGTSALAWASDYPSKPIELIVPVAAGGGTDIVGRAFSEVGKKYLPQQPMIVVNKPGASGAIGTAELINAKPDGYKIGIVICELTIIPNLGITKYTAADLRPIARLNADPSAITVRADAPWQTIEEFIADARKRKDPVSIANAGVGSIWHMAAAAFSEKLSLPVNHVPFLGAAPAAVALLGGHVDALAVSPGEVAPHVAAGKMRTLAVMADQRVGGLFEKVPTLKERGIDLSIGVWRGLAVPKATPPDIVATLGTVAAKTADDAAFREVLAKSNLGWAYTDAAAFQKVIDKDRAFYAELVPRLGLQK